MASAFRHGQSWCKYFPVTSQSCASPQVLAEMAERSAAEAHLQGGAAHVSAVVVVVVVYIDVVVLMRMMAALVVVVVLLLVVVVASTLVVGVLPA